MTAAAETVQQDDPIVWEPPPGGVARALVPFAQALQRDDQRRLGQRRTGQLARAFNRRAERYRAFRRQVYEERFEELLDQAGGLSAPRIELRDGFAIDRSGSLPHLDALVAAGEEIVASCGGQQWEFAKPYLQDISPPRAAHDHPALLDFISSPDAVAAYAPAFGYVPALCGSLPKGVRLMESSTRFDPHAEGPWRGSQLYHLDYHATPTVYVIVAIRDIAPDDGPLQFVGRAASQRVADALGYGRRKVPYRLTDDVVHSLVEPDELHVFAEPAGTVLFIESSACLHFGSRKPVNDRYQWQYGLTAPVRNDLFELWGRQRVFPVRAEDPALRRLVMDRRLLAL